MEVVASLSQGRTAAAQCDLFTHKSVPVIFEPPCSIMSCRPVLKFYVVSLQSKKFCPFGIFRISFFRCIGFCSSRVN